MKLKVQRHIWMYPSLWLFWLFWKNDSSPACVHSGQKSQAGYFFQLSNQVEKEEYKASLWFWALSIVSS